MSFASCRMKRISIVLTFAALAVAISACQIEPEALQMLMAVCMGFAGIDGGPYMQMMGGQMDQQSMQAMAFGSQMAQLIRAQSSDENGYRIGDLLRNNYQQTLAVGNRQGMGGSHSSSSGGKRDSDFNKYVRYINKAGKYKDKISKYARRYDIPFFDKDSN